MTGPPTDRCEAVLPTALALVGAVRDSPADVTRILTTADLPAMCVLLAALVPDDQTAANLLAWYQPDPQQLADWNGRNRQAAHETNNPGLRGSKASRPPSTVCGQPNWHASFNRHKYAGETPCGPCSTRETAYQRERKARQRKATRDAA